MKKESTLEAKHISISTSELAKLYDGQMLVSRMIWEYKHIYIYRRL